MAFALGAALAFAAPASAQDGLQQRDPAGLRAQSEALERLRPELLKQLDALKALDALKNLKDFKELKELKTLEGLDKLKALQDLAPLDVVARLDQSLQQMAQALQQQALSLQQRAQRQAREPRQPPQPPQPPQARDNRSRGPEVTERFNRTVRLGRDGTIDISNIAGTVVITGSGGDQVEIQAVKRVSSRNDADAQAALRELEIQVNERSGLVELRTELPRRRNVSAAVDFTIAAPSGSNVVVKTVSGDIRVRGIKGDLRAESISGNVNLSEVERLRAVKSVSGNSELADAGGDDVSANTVSGDVVVRKLRSRGVELQSVSGNLRFTDADAERVNLRSISGDIEYEGRLERSGRYDMQSHSGDIRIVPVGNPGFDIEASTFSGDVRSDYALTLRGSDAASGDRRPRLNRTIRGAFGDASAILSLRSFSGNIMVVKK
jgi:hypothetical protein